MLLADLELRQRLAIFVRLLLAHVVVALQQHAAAFQHLRELLVHFRAHEFGDGQTRQQVDGQLEFFLGAVERSDLQLGESRPPLSGIVLGLARPCPPGSASRKDPGSLAELRRRAGLRARRDARSGGRSAPGASFDKLRAQYDIVAQVVDADAETFERNKGRGRGQIRRRRFFRRAA